MSQASEPYDSDTTEDESLDTTREWDDLHFLSCDIEDYLLRRGSHESDSTDITDMDMVEAIQHLQNLDLSVSLADLMQLRFIIKNVDSTYIRLHLQNMDSARHAVSLDNTRLALITIITCLEHLRCNKTSFIHLATHKPVQAEFESLKELLYSMRKYLFRLLRVLLTISTVCESFLSNLFKIRHALRLVASEITNTLDPSLVDMASLLLGHIMSFVEGNNRRTDSPVQVYRVLAIPGEYGKNTFKWHR